MCANGRALARARARCGRCCGVHSSTPVRYSMETLPEWGGRMWTHRTANAAARTNVVYLVDVSGVQTTVSKYESSGNIWRSTTGRPAMSWFSAASCCRRPKSTQARSVKSRATEYTHSEERPSLNTGCPIGARAGAGYGLGFRDHHMLPGRDQRYFYSIDSSLLWQALKQTEHLFSRDNARLKHMEQECDL